MPSPARLAAEVVCCGFSGATPGDAPVSTLAALGIRAVILFSRNVNSAEGVATLTSELQRALRDDLPAIVAVDQEGGRVARLHEGVVQLPSMMALGVTNDPDLARRAGRRLAGDLRNLGINLDFAPVLDLAVEPANTVIGNRSFGSDPQRVATMATAFAAGLHEGGVIAVAKHFPGHGATHVDSHHALPVLDLDETTWRARDLVPFRDAIASGIPAVMSAHVLLRCLDPDNPATRSARIVTGILRRELQFDGAVFSDCLEMAALGVPPEQSAPAALAAGVDCVVISHRPELAEAAIVAIERAVENGTLPLVRLEEAAARMRRLRGTIRDVHPSGGDDDIGVRIATDAVTILRGSVELPAHADVTVVSFENGRGASLSSALRRRGHKSEIMRVGLDASPDDVELLEMILRGLGGRRVVVVMRRAHLYPDEAVAVRRLLAAFPDAILVSALEPYDAALFDEARNVACVYDDTEVAFEGLAGVMTRRSAAVR